MPVVGIEDTGKRIRGMQVPGEQAADCGLTVGFWFAVVGAFGGVEAYRVMELVAVSPGLLEQVPAGQGPEQLPCLGESGVEESRGCRDADFRAWVQAQEPEGPGRSGGSAR